ncbi:hypothetical protein [Occultella gossypii]|uniref:Lipoprotein n=1 Tax=Occultella gossypii TaxID=2800820 RepID=A0ABS7SAP0_9MICO|nr:hypothetical protein [Occultella gossypii]MBZ2196749.1 hypothetical protein [Occultella gossypii]
MVFLAGCSGDAEQPVEPDATTAGAGPRPLTSEEAERLAVARFRNYDDGVREVSFEVTDSGVTYAVDAWVDWVNHVGYGAVADAAGSESLLLAWTPSGLSTYPWTPGEPAPLPAPGLAGAAAQEWTSSELAPDASRLHTLLALVVDLGADRPDNALLLSQTDARWLRVDDVDGVSVDVIAGPTADVVYDPATSTAAGDGSDATVRYWVTDDGTILRLEVRLGGAGEWTPVEFGPAADVEFAQDFLGGEGG